MSPRVAQVVRIKPDIKRAPTRRLTLQNYLRRLNMNFFVLGLGFAGGAVVTLAVCAAWFKHNKKRLAKVLTFFDVQARLDEILAKTDLDEKVVEVIKDVRTKVDKII